MSNQKKSKPNFVVIAVILIGALLLGILGGTAIALVRMTGKAEPIAKNSNVSPPQSVSPTPQPTKENSVDVDAVIKELNTFPINFPSGKTTVAPESKFNLEKIAEKLKTLSTGTIIEIGVHSDNVGNFDANLTLSGYRAKSIKNDLVNLGVKAEMLTEKGYGGEKPIVNSNTAEGSLINRRVEFTLVKTN